MYVCMCACVEVVRVSLESLCQTPRRPCAVCLEMGNGNGNGNDRFYCKMVIITKIINLRESTKTTVFTSTDIKHQ